jgi:hypothetical protein
MARIVMDLRFVFKVFLIEKNPAARNGRQTTPQTTQKMGGRYPSIMCMALAVGMIPKLIASAADSATSFFCFLLISSPFIRYHAKIA